MRWIIACSFAFFALAESVLACTAFQLKSHDNALLYCRSMEYSIPLNSDLLIVPRGTPFEGSAPGQIGMRWESKYGLVGMNQAFGQKIVTDGMNEKGLVVGCLYLPGYTQYEKYDPARLDSTIAAWEVPDFLLSTCATVAEAKEAIAKVVVAEQKVRQNEDLVLPLHFYICDSTNACLIVEYVNGERQMHDNPLGVLTNSPPFQWHLANLGNYANISSVNIPQMTLGEMPIVNFGQGSGLLGLPGDPTPRSRFVRAAVFSREASQPKSAIEAVRLGFHILNTFDVFEGMIKRKAKNEIVNADITQWVIVHDRTNLKTYVRNYDSLHVQMVDLKKIDFADPGLRHISFHKDFMVEDVTLKNQPLAKLDSSVDLESRVR